MTLLEAIRLYSSFQIPFKRTGWKVALRINTRGYLIWSNDEETATVDVASLAASDWEFADSTEKENAFSLL